MKTQLKFKCVLVTGGGGGIGKALAQHFASLGKKVIIAGRTESNLRASAREIGAAAYYVLDTGLTSTIPDFIEKITAEHPDLDCLVNSAAVQRPIDVLKHDGRTFLSKADQEIDSNVRGPMHLTMGLLEHFRSKPFAVIINMSSILGFAPYSTATPVYNATKAWVHFWSINLRSQLKDEESNIRVIEIAPPLVESNLHRDRSDPDDNKKTKNPASMSLRQFIKEVSRKLETGQDMITAGTGNVVVSKWYENFGYCCDC